MNDLIKAYDDYLKFLDEANYEPINVAWVHGWRCPDSIIKKGDEHRGVIALLKQKYGLEVNP